MGFLPCLHVLLVVTYLSSISQCTVRDDLLLLANLHYVVREEVDTSLGLFAGSSLEEDIVSFLRQIKVHMLIPTNESTQNTNGQKILKI